MFKYKIIVLLTLLTQMTSIVLAQVGPVVPCDNCQQYNKLTPPLNGLWFNPAQSGVGISIELQKNLLFGVYYGYDESGDSTWFTFLAPLVKSDDPEVMWTVDVNLVEFENGTCQNCAYQAPNHTDFSSTMQIKFRHKNYASFSINNGAQQNIVPLVFGTSQSQDFANVTSYWLADLSGQWVFVNKVNIFPQVSDIYSRGQVIQITKQPSISHEDGTFEINYKLDELYLDGVFETGDIKCKTSLDNEQNIIGPTCTYTLLDPAFQFTPAYFNFPLSGLGASRLFGESAAGHTFEAIKLDQPSDHPDK